MKIITYLILFFSNFICGFEDEVKNCKKKSFFRVNNKNCDTLSNIVEFPDNINVVFNENIRYFEKVEQSILHHKPDVILTTAQIIEENGYPIEKHKVITEDGYILEMHRLPRPGKPVVFLQHGFTCSSAVWIHMGPNHSLGYMLYDEGFDVWMGNSRGNVYSRAHLKLDPDVDIQYWDFSWHEMGIYDLPAEIEYVLNKTGNKKLTFVGHSMGTTLFLVLASERPEFKSKIIQNHALAPVSFLNGGDERPFIMPKTQMQTFQTLLKNFGYQEFPPFINSLHRFGRQYCSDKSKMQKMCLQGYYWLFGGSEKSGQVNKSYLSSLISHIPSTTSLKTAKHYTQQIDTGKFSMYDYDSDEKNLMKYGSVSPPQYNVTKITTATYIYYSSADNLCHVQDTKRLCDLLSNCKEMYQIPIEGFNHADFIWGKDIKDIINMKIINTIKKQVNKMI